MQAIRLVADGAALLSPSVTRRVIREFASHPHVSRAMIKLGARDRAQLVVFAYQSGLVDCLEGGAIATRR